MSRPMTEKTSNAFGKTNQLDMGATAGGVWSEQEQQALYAAGRKKRYLAKEVIYRESDRIDRIYVIRSGLVKLLSYLPNGRARIVRLHASNHWIGLDGLLGQPYEHTAIAVGDVEVQHISIHSLQHLNHDNPGVLGQLLCQWHGALAHADRWISDFSTGGIKPRVARLLEFLAELEYDQPLDRVELLTVCEMAEILGVTQESVSRILATFKRRDILQKQSDPSREIYRLDASRLQREAQE
ncbi:MAG: Crp/Fnr family transcriptional regulator [Gammaproteobacteria bacterium]